MLSLFLIHYLHPPSQFSPASESIHLSNVNVLGILLSAFFGGFFAGLWSNYFESRRRIHELRRDKYIDHRNTIVQIEHELIPIRVNLSRNLQSLKIALDSTNNRNIRLILRLYKMTISPGLNLKLLDINLINEYLELYTILASINSDIQYLEGVVDIIKDDLRNKKLDRSLLGVYSQVVSHLYKSCQKSDDKSLSLLSKCIFIVKLSEEEIKKKYIKSGGAITYTIAEKDVKKRRERIVEEETRPRKGEKDQFVAPYIDVKNIPA